MKNINGTVSWGIIGCGNVCEVKSGPAFNKVANSKLVAVMRRNPDKAKDFAQRHGVPKYYADAAELINDAEVNAVYIATPPSSHESYLEMALKAGKPVYVEKPVTVNAVSVERMMAMERQYQGKVSVAHYRRGVPLFNKIKQRQCKFIGHVTRGEGMENLVTTGKIPGKRDRGRQREKILDDVCRWLGVKDNKDIFRDVRYRTRWRNMIDNAFRQGT